MCCNFSSVCRGLDEVEDFLRGNGGAGAGGGRSSSRLLLASDIRFRFFSFMNWLPGEPLGSSFLFWSFVSKPAFSCSFSCS